MSRVTATVTDRAGHTASASVTYTVAGLPPGVTNLALGKAAFGSAPAALSEGPEKAVNGLFTGLSNKFCTLAADKFLHIDLGAAATLSQIKVYHAAVGGEPRSWNTKDFDVQLSPDGVVWTTVAFIGNNTADVSTITVPDLPFFPRHVRLAIWTPTQDGNAAARIYEVEAYGSFVVSPPPPPPPPVGYQPLNASNTGVPAGTVLTRRDGSLRVATHGDVIENMDIRGNVVVAANVVVLRNCKITSSAWTVIQNDGLNLLVDHCEINGLNGTGNSMGIQSRNFEARRCNIYGVENASHFNGNCKFIECYIHDQYTGGGAHTDGVQFGRGSGNMEIKRCNFAAQPSRTACVNIWNEDDPQCHHVYVEDNRLDGTGASFAIYVPRQGPVTEIRVNRNIMRTGVWGPNYFVDGHYVTEFEGNIDEATGNLIRL